MSISVHWTIVRVRKWIDDRRVHDAISKVHLSLVPRSNSVSQSLHKSRFRWMESSVIGLNHGACWSAFHPVRASCMSAEIRPLTATFPTHLRLTPRERPGLTTPCRKWLTVSCLAAARIYQKYLKLIRASFRILSGQQVGIQEGEQSFFLKKNQR